MDIFGAHVSSGKLPESRLRNETPGGFSRPTESPSDRHGLKPALFLLAASFAALAIVSLYPSGRGGQYAVIAPPWFDRGQTITLIQRSDGMIADMAGPANIAVAYSPSPDFVNALYRAGAWLVLDPVALRGCVDGAVRAEGFSQ